MEYHEPWLCGRGLFQILPLGILHFYLAAIGGGRIVCRQGSGFLKGPVGNFRALAAEQYMASGDVLRVKPPVGSSRLMEGQFLILIIVFSNVDIKSVTADIVQGGGFFFGTLCAFCACAAGTFLASLALRIFLAF